MAKISAGSGEKVFKITKWLGVNQAQEGESRLALGEAADMRNFRVTAGGALRKRPGSRNVAGLLNAFELVVDSSVDEELLVEGSGGQGSFVMYPSAVVGDTGVIELTGASERVTRANAEGHAGWFYRDENGAVHKFAGVRRIGG